MQALKPHPCGLGARLSHPKYRKLTVYANKGFGDSKQSTSKKFDNDTSSDGPTKRRANKSKGKSQRRLPQGASTVQVPPSAPPQTLQPDDTESLVEGIEFEERLKVLKQQSMERKVETKAAITAMDPFAIDPLALPPKRDDPYANPPPLAQTLFGSGEEKTASDKDYEGLGAPSQVGLAVASLALVAVFLITSGGSDLGSAGRSRKPTNGPGIEMSQETKDELTTELAKFEATLASSPSAVGAVEGAAVVNARLGNYEKAIPLLTKLTQLKPDSPDVYRVLAESQGAAGNSKEAIAAYQQAWKASNENNMEILTGLSAEMVAAGQPKQAVDMLRGLISGGKTPAVGEVEVQLLLAKTYSQWPGHIPDALNQYDSIAEAHPDDFRPALGKGLVLLQDGQAGDAARYFLQARYLSPKQSRGAVEAIIQQAQQASS